MCFTQFKTQSRRETIRTKSTGWGEEKQKRTKRMLLIVLQTMSDDKGFPLDEQLTYAQHFTCKDS